MNGKLDLTQAEAVQALIGAKNEFALDAAGDQLQGRLSERIRHFQKSLVDIAAMLEAWVDFPEEGIEFSSNEEVALALQKVILEMESLLSTYHEGRILHEGVSICLAGSPNVGKSSLMNALLDKERAIVTPIAGTTRDVLEDHVRLNGLNVRLMDTAGIRETNEEIEQEGIRRTRQAINKADLVLLVLDVSQELAEQDHLLLQEIPSHKTVVIWNKIDLPHSTLPILSFEHIVKVSAKQNLGLDQLRACVDKVIWQRGVPGRDEVMITNMRHKEALQKAIEACQRTLQGFQEGLSPEFLCVDMRACLQELGKIIGSDITEDILSAIFSKFCIGK
jgi:tRNA modification GTPase